MKNEVVSRPQLTKTCHRDSYECIFEQTPKHHPSISKDISPITTSVPQMFLGSSSLLLSAVGMEKEGAGEGQRKESLSPGLSSEFECQEGNLATQQPGDSRRQVAPRGVGWEKQYVNHTWPAAQPCLQPGFVPDKAQAFSFFFSSIYSLNQQTLGYKGQSKLSNLNKGIRPAAGALCDDK